MKKPPCARFGMRIRPKASENPEESRNSRPPKAMLFSVWMIQNCMESAAPSGGCVSRGQRSTKWCAADPGSRLLVYERVTGVPHLRCITSCCTACGTQARHHYALHSRFFAGG